MKPLAIVLMNVAAVVGTIVVYDQVRSRDPAPSSVVIEGTDVDVVDLRERLESLEAERRPVLTAAGTDPRVLARLEALERSIGPAAPIDEPTDAPDVEGRPSESADSGPLPSFDGEPTKDEIQRFRKLQAAVRRQERIEKERKRVGASLDKLGIAFSPTQREDIHTAYAAFQPRVDEIWSAVKTQARETMMQGGQVDRATIVTETTALIEQEFASTLVEIVPQGDAEAVAQALLSK